MPSSSGANIRESCRERSAPRPKGRRFQRTASAKNALDEPGRHGDGRGDPTQRLDSDGISANELIVDLHLDVGVLVGRGVVQACGLRGRRIILVLAISEAHLAGINRAP